MSEYAIILSIIGVAALSLWFSMTLDEEKHIILKLLMLFFFFAVMLLLPKAAVDSRTVCETVVSNSTTVGSYNVYEYHDFCYVRPESTSVTFWTLTSRMYYLFIGYAIVFMAVWAMFKLRDSTRGKL